jgi:hypothetical protein
MHATFRLKNLKEMDYLEDLRIDGRMPFFTEIVLEVVEWIHLAQDRNQCMARENNVINFPASQKEGNFLTSCVTTSFSKRTLLPGVG